MEQQRIHQEERVRKALERAKAEPKKQVSHKTFEGLNMVALVVSVVLKKFRKLLKIYFFT